ncbi:hypothetical protein AVEN_143881-1 [Araneus ventricosus]|uniref:Uncharacterized protein n=1 Tax=Araneus ventricosus TaxID=182803 RepID=A0A4Y2QR40_ARAVE|nr:hypothetical protein AVEN_143881-1 [Araneus ventricosus]
MPVTGVMETGYSTAFGGGMTERVLFHLEQIEPLSKTNSSPNEVCFVRQMLRLILYPFTSFPDSNFSLQQACHKFVMTRVQVCDKFVVTRVQACSKLTKAPKSP